MNENGHGARHEVKEALREFLLDKVDFLFNSELVEPMLDRIADPHGEKQLSLNFQIVVPEETLLALRKKFSP